MQNLFTKSYGEGKPILLLHGFCEDSRVWDVIVPPLSKNNKVITIDIPGFGKSSLVNDEEITLEDMATLIKEEVLQEGIDRCTMIGHSMGGYLTLAFAEKYPEFVNGFGLFHSTAYADTDFKKENRIKHIDFVKRNGIEPFVKTLIPSLFSAKHNYTQQVENSLQMAKECSVSGVTNALQAMSKRPERLDVLNSSKVPVLLIAGKDDVLIPVEKLAYQASLPNRCQFEILQKSGHMGMVEEPEKSVAILNEFIDFVSI